MTTKLAFALALLAAGSGAALADHNSKWGEGTAFDPTSMHDDRFDTLDTAGEEPFSETVEIGGGQSFDIFAILRQGRPDTIDIDAGGSSAADTASMGGGSSGHGGGSGNGGGGRR